jgi:hypothetical protein
VTKVVAIGGSKKNDDPDECSFCGAKPWHHVFRCPKVARVELFEDGTLSAVEYFDPDVWQPT